MVVRQDRNVRDRSGLLRWKQYLHSNSFQVHDISSTLAGHHQRLRCTEKIQFGSSGDMQAGCQTRTTAVSVSSKEKNYTVVMARGYITHAGPAHLSRVFHPQRHVALNPMNRVWPSAAALSRDAHPQAHPSLGMRDIFFSMTATPNQRWPSCARLSWRKP